jgi:hypothetical protein
MGIYLTRPDNKKMDIYRILPVPEPRQTSRDKWDPSGPVLRYRAFKDEVNLRKLKLPIEGYHVIFVLPMPPSWSAKKRAEMAGQPHQQKPDKDNLEKALLDALHKDDAHVWDGRASKIWGYTPAIIVDTASPVDLKKYANI